MAKEIAKIEGYDPDQPSGRKGTAFAKRKARSAVSNGSRPFVEGDGGSAWARRWKDLVALHADDLGGVDALSASQLALIRSACTIRVQLEAAEGVLSKGGAVDLDAYARGAGHLRRILETLGLKRIAREIGRNPIVEHFARPIVREASK